MQQEKPKRRTSPFHRAWAVRRANGSWRLITPVCLSMRHEQVMKLLSKGTRQVDIAAVLKLSPVTVGSFVRSLKEKFGVYSERALFLVAIELYGRSNHRKSASAATIRREEPLIDPDAEGRLWK
jgi:DNA-binding NarL/FixJ family response regulator